MKIIINNVFKNELIDLIGNKEYMILESNLIDDILLNLHNVKTIFSFSCINNFHISYRVDIKKDSLIITIKDIENEKLNYNLLVF